MNYILKQKFYCGIMTHNNKEYPHTYPIIITPTLYQEVQEEITKQLDVVFQNMQIPKGVAQQTAQTLQQLHKDKIEFHNQQYDTLTKEYKETTKMLDNLYLDKLKSRITDSDYDKFYTRLRDQQVDVDIQLSKLQEAEDNYYITPQYVITLADKAYELFKSSEVEEKRQLIKLVLSNLELKDKNLVYNVQKPFDSIVEYNDRQEWCAR
ncbi:MAG: hypothetical protein CL947_03400 [Epsilonproteobacteria bacterium]|nr:hypothetical protein [Campylobacterota bacterium]